jgi:hypothetical protein
MTDKKFTHRVDPAKRLAELRDAGAGKVAPEVEEPLALALDDADEQEAEAFSTLSADRQHKVMLELRFQAGNARAFAYSYLVSIDFDPSQGIRIDFSGYEVRITGRNLRPLFAGLVAQRVAFVVEMDDLHAEATLSKDAPVVTGIEVVERE